MIEQPLIEDHIFKASWYEQYQAFLADGRDAELKARLDAWAQREVLNETASEAAFIQRFFVETWGYAIQGGQGDGAYWGQKADAKHESNRIYEHDWGCRVNSMSETSQRIGQYSQPLND